MCLLFKLEKKLWWTTGLALKQGRIMCLRLCGTVQIADAPTAAEAQPLPLALQIGQSVYPATTTSDSTEWFLWLA